MAISTEVKLQMKELELNALFETIRAINSNASEEDLFRIFKFINRSNPNLSKIGVYVFDEEWIFKTSYGTDYDYSKIPLDPAIFQITSISGEEILEKIAYFNEFEKVMPVKHGQKVLAYVFLSKSEKVDDEEKLDIDFLSALSHIIIVAVENKKLARKEKKQEALRQQLAIARNVQNLLFPKKLPQKKHISVFASYQPHHSVGGDYYDFIQIDKHRFLMCVADVAGKGIPAAILMSNFQAALRILIRHTDDLKKIVNELNLLIMENAGGENFITAFFVLYDFQHKKLTYINSGHNPPILFRNPEEVMQLRDGSTILGCFSPLPFLKEGVIEHIDDFLLFCFTDGFTETHNELGEEFGEIALQKFVADRYTMTQGDLHKQLLDFLNYYKGANNFADDITLLSCRVESKGVFEL